MLSYSFHLSTLYSSVEQERIVLSHTVQLCVVIHTPPIYLSYTIQLCIVTCHIHIPPIHTIHSSVVEECVLRCHIHSSYLHSSFVQEGIVLYLPTSYS